MAVLCLEHPRLTVSLDVPDPLIGVFARNFAFALAGGLPSRVDEAYRVLPGDGVPHLFRGDALLGRFADLHDLVFALEEDIENALLARAGDWMALHAGAAVLRDAAIVIVGRPDTGKTTTTFQLVELGLELLCEEIAAVDPRTLAVQPFPQVLTLSRAYAEAFRARFPVVGGALSVPTASVARYAAHRVRRRPAPARVVLFPAFDPSREPALARATPGEVLTELLGHCFPPAGGDERLYDDVIRLAERCRLIRLFSNGIEATRSLLGEVLANEL
jgi:hypothetical protein